MSEEMNHNERNETADQPLPPPPPTAQPVVPPTSQPGSQPAAPETPQPQTQPQAEQPVAPQQQPQTGQPVVQNQNPSGQAQDPQTAGQTPQGQQPGQQQGPNQADQPEPTFRENGAFSFFAVPSDPDDDPAPMNWGFKIAWFILGLLGGMLGLVMTWISTTTLSPKRRRQALIAVWLGFACQAVIFLIIVLMGGSFPIGSTGNTAAQSAGSGSTSAFG